MLRDRLLDIMRTRFGDDTPPLRLVFPDRGSFDFSPNPTVTITFHSTKPLQALLRGDFDRAADAYVAGEISLDGPIEAHASTLEPASGSLPRLAIEAATPEAVRIWRAFLAGMAYAFDHGWLSVAQVLSFNPRRTERFDVPGRASTNTGTLSSRRGSDLSDSPEDSNGPDRAVLRIGA